MSTGGHQAAQEAGPGVGHVEHDEAGARPGADQGQHELGRDGLLRLLPRGQKGTLSISLLNQDYSCLILA